MFLGTVSQLLNDISEPVHLALSPVISLNSMFGSSASSKIFHGHCLIVTCASIPKYENSQSPSQLEGIREVISEEERFILNDFLD